MSLKLRLVKDDTVIDGISMDALVGNQLVRRSDRTKRSIKYAQIQTSFKRVKRLSHVNIQSC